MKKLSEFNKFPEEITNDPRWRNATWRFMCVMKKVTDGDTALLLADLGFRTYSFLSIRIDGYDAWELFKGSLEERKRGKIAKEALLERIPIDSPVGIITEEDTTFDRWVATVLYVTPEGTVEDIKIYMEKEGHTKRQILEELYG
jgi:hypothetical protein